MFINAISVGFCQNVLVKGCIKDLSTNSPIPYVNVGIKNSFTGTISNSEGDFSLPLNRSSLKNKIIISCIGYESFVVDSINREQYYNIFLQPKRYQLTDVTVTNIDSANIILSKAFQNIKNNYANKPIKQFGLYRESLKNLDNNYQYFAELLLEVYKSSYQNKSLGQVKIVNSRRSHTNFSDSINNVRFFGGHFTPTTRDVVKMKNDFINPKKFNNYKYIYTGVDRYMGNVVYEIDFYTTPGNTKGNYKGKILIDTCTYAYLAFKLNYTKNGLKNRNRKNPFAPLKCMEREQLVIYQKAQNYYYLKYTNDIEKTKNTNSNRILISEDEFICTRIETDNISPIPLEDQMPRTSFVSDFSKPYAKTNWKEQAVLKPNNQLVKYMNYSKYEAKALLETDRIESNAKRTLSFFKKIFLDAGCSYSQFKDYASHIDIAFSPVASNSCKISNTMETNYLLSYYGALGYQISCRYSLFYSFSSAVKTKAFFDQSLSFGGEYIFPILNRGKLIMGHLSLGYIYKEAGINLGVYDNPESFRLNKKTFNSSKIRYKVGAIYQGVSTNFSLSTNLTTLLNIHLAFGYDNFFSKNDYLYVAEKSNIITDKSTKVSLSSSSIDYKENGQPRSEITQTLNPFTLKLALRYTLNY